MDGYYPGNKKNGKKWCKLHQLMNILAEKYDDWNGKNAIFDRETDIIFDVFQFHENH